MMDGAATPIGWERALMAAEKVKERLRRATKALDDAGVPYAVVGGNAVAEWVARVDEDAVRNTRDVDLLLRRSDFPAARAALEATSFVYHPLANRDAFADGPDRARSDVRLLYAGERLEPEHAHVMPDLAHSERGRDFQVVNLATLVWMKLVAGRNIDLTHLLDMIGVGLIDASWPARLPPPLDARLQQLLDNPDG
jgi:hypothetical protein